MKNFDPIKDVKDRVALVSKWQKRLDKLANREAKAMKTSAFCIKHGINLQWLSRAKQQRPLPYHRKIKQVEAALKSEGV